ncbi:MAG TPA: rhomboid family intramembrane serine protease [Candidatus Acidoferrum sp.]|nr:rhomboid family intramembrane serine protease [Candidatus Acidoferrum sp.]
MQNPIQRFFSSLPLGARVLVFLYLVGYPLALLGHYTHTADLYDWLGLWPPLVRKGEVWLLVSYAFLPNGPVDWVVSIFWLATLVSVMGRHWSAGEMWGYCLLATLVGALVVFVANPALCGPVVGNGAMIFALLAAWYRLYGRERLILLGFGEISVRQATVIVAVIEVLVSLFCLGWLVTLAMMSGGVAGWFYLYLRGKTAMNRRSQVVGSERIARLEL